MCVILYHRQDREPSETMKETDDQPTSESSFSRSQTHGNKKRKVNERTVVTVRIKENQNKQQKKIEWPPADSWSWRKYGQKPIKGSPHPRGYYRCSTSKGCSAKKQVERCKTDASMLIVTYTSTHNHPGRDDRFSSATKKRRPKRFDNSAANREDHYSPATTPKQESDQEEDMVQETNDEHQFQRSPQSHPFVDSTVENFVAINRDESNPFPGNQEKPCTFFRSEVSKPFYDEAAESSSPIKSDQDDEFYDELEELPTPLFLASFMRSSFGKERILVNPS